MGQSVLPEIELDRSDPTPLYHQIERQLAQQIENGHLRSGSRLLSARAMQQKLNVNFRTVLTAYSRLQRRGLVHSTPGRGTIVLVPSAKQWIGMLMLDPFTAETSPYYRLIAGALYKQLELEGYALKLYVESPASQAAARPGAVRFAEFLEDLRNRVVQGAVIMPDLAETTVYDDLRSANVPYVQMGVGSEHYRCGVSPDKVTAVRMGMEYLIAQGKRRIALLAGVLDHIDGKDVIDTRGYEDIMKRHQLPWHPHWLQYTQPTSEEGGYLSAKSIWSRQPLPDALVIDDDIMAKGACTALLERGVRVPDDLLLAVQANKGSGIMYPFPAALLEFDPQALARTACDMLVEAIQQKTPVRSWVSVPPVLVTEKEEYMEQADVTVPAST